MALIQCDFFSESLGMCCSMNVILPQQTERQIGMSGVSRQGLCPVLYLLHGYSDDHSIWLRRTSIERYVAPLGLAVVMPAVHKSYYTDQANGDPYWMFISEELPAICRDFFPISDKREDKFAAGLSMGGYGAFKLALRKPESFSAAASLSGALDIANISRRKQEKIREFERTFGPADKVRNSQNDLLYVAAKLAEAEKPRPKLFQCCGTEDFLIEQNHIMRDHLQKLNFDLHYEEGSGSHEWGYWDTMIQKVLDWLPISKAEEAK